MWSWCKELNIPALKAKKDSLLKACIQAENARRLLPAGFDSNFNLSTNPTSALTKDQLNHQSMCCSLHSTGKSNIFG